MAKVKEDIFRLYIDSMIYRYESFEEATEAAREYMPDEPSLRIEIVGEDGPIEADWWAYDYESNMWAPS